MIYMLMAMRYNTKRFVGKKELEFCQTHSDIRARVLMHCRHESVKKRDLTLTPRYCEIYEERDLSRLASGRGQGLVRTTLQYLCKLY